MYDHVDNYLIDKIITLNVQVTDDMDKGDIFRREGRGENALRPAVT